MIISTILRSTQPTMPPGEASSSGHGAPGQRFQMLSTGAATVLFLLGVVGCGVETPDRTEPAPAFRVTLPSAPPLTVDDIEVLKEELAKVDGDPPAQQLSAAAFDDYSAIPRRDDPEWGAFIDTYAEVRDIALAHGWSVLIEGFTQASAPAGTADPLSDRRATRARSALLDLGYPPPRVSAVGRGVGGPSPEDRRVLITFVRSQR